METSNYLSKRLKNLKVGIPQYTDFAIATEITGSIKSHVSLSPIVSNPQTINDKCNIPEYHNAHSWGPVTIGLDGIVVIDEGSVWTIG
jgi:hypothetical protein